MLVFSRPYRQKGSFSVRTFENRGQVDAASLADAVCHLQLQRGNRERRIRINETTSTKSATITTTPAAEPKTTTTSTMTTTAPTIKSTKNTDSLEDGRMCAGAKGTKVGD